MKCIGKHSVKVRISLDTENKKKSTAENWMENNTMKMIKLQYTLAVKNKLNIQMKEYGVCMFCEVS